MDILFLGTACMAPTKERNHPAVLLTYKDQGILFDCGEGTQRQLKLANVKMTRITKILLTHWHGDHALGIGGLLQTLGASEYQGTLDLYGPIGSKERFYHLFKAIPFKFRVSLVIHEVSNGVVYENDEYIIESQSLEHNTPCNGYSFTLKPQRRILMEKVKERGIPVGPLIGKLQQGQTVTHNGKTVLPEEVSVLVPGKKVAYVTDTRLCNACYQLAENADVLITESSFLQKDEDKAEEYNHLTAQQAGLIASKSGAKQLYLFHISSRYPDTTPILEEARTIHPSTFVAQDFQRVNLDKQQETTTEERQPQTIVDEETPEEQAHREESRKMGRKRVTLKKKKR